MVGFGYGLVWLVFLGAGGVANCLVGVLGFSLLVFVWFGLVVGLGLRCFLWLVVGYYFANVCFIVLIVVNVCVV